MRRLPLLFILLFSLSTIYSQTNPYVILVSFDGFRWDYLNRGLTPNLDKIKNDGVSAISLRSVFPSKTFPNHLSIITGMYAENHGIISNSFPNFEKNYWYRMSDTTAVRDSKWYIGEAFWETAERQGTKTASYFWPGSEVQLEHRHPSYREFYEHEKPYEQRVEGVINWLQLPYEARPHFITLYFDDTDTYGHKFGPSSPEANEAIVRLDNIAGLLMKRLNDIGLKDSVNVIFVADHGMTEIFEDKVINIENMIKEYNCRFMDDGPLMQVEPSAENLTAVYEILKRNESHYKAYLKKDIPDYFHYNKNPLTFSILLAADIGWSLVTNRRSDWVSKSKGNHGYDNNHLDMHGIFLADGPAFKDGYQTGTLWNIDIYPMLCKIFNIYPRSNIDGELERIEFILKE
ncbi:MAG: alkaline phosphatase family protein [Ignavibacteriaceae bacterium]|nr:alkaline phosphatase family protein [Ignavibacteriaceae bacterium]